VLAASGGICDPLDCGTDPVPPEVPSPSFSMSKESVLDLRFDWDEVAGASGYRIWRSSGPQFTREERVGSTAGETTLLETGGATAEPESWFYLVRAINSCEWEGP
jgi:hypothetical protein